MFSKFVIFSGLIAAVLSAALQEPVPIVSQDSDISPDGSFQWSYQSADGSAQQQSGQLQGNGDEASEVVQGSAQWTDPQGGQHQLTYVADAEGYKPQSDDIPQPSPAILRSLEWNAAHPEEETRLSNSRT